MKTLLFIIGATNSGKSTFLEKVKARHGSQVHLVQVGKVLRAKYPPGFFEGQAAPAKTQAEALEIMFSGIEEGESRFSKIILVDGQPRDLDQLTKIESHPFKRAVGFIHLYAPREVREERARARDSGDALDLSLRRMEKDVIILYDIHCRLLANRRQIYTYDTSGKNFDPNAAVQLTLGRILASQPVRL